MGQGAEQAAQVDPAFAGQQALAAGGVDHFFHREGAADLRARGRIADLCVVQQLAWDGTDVVERGVGTIEMQRIHQDAGVHRIACGADDAQCGLRVRHRGPWHEFEVGRQAVGAHQFAQPGVALGQARLVGVVDFSDFPSPVSQLPQVGSYARLDLEAIVALKPDLIIGWQSGNAPAQIDKLRALGIPVYLSQPNRIDDIANEIERFGVLAATSEAATA